MKFDPTSKKLLWIGIIFYLITTICSSNTPFFWDTILTSSVAQWFYNNGIQRGIAPIIWDAGHPTFFQIYLTFAWKIFGKNLMISHLAMLPFLWLMTICFIYLLQKITLSLVSRVLGFILLLIHPYILTQSTLVSYDIVQIAFFLLAIIGIIDNRKLILVLGLWGLSSCSIRGQIVAILCLGSYCVIYFKNWKEFLPIILCSVIPIVAWHTYHYSNTDWMISTPSSTWESQRSFANPQQIISNIIGITRGFIDYGMIGLSLLFFIALNQFRKIKWNNIEKQLFSILFIVFVGMNGSMIFFSNPIGHRYFMIIHVLMILLIVSRIEQIKNFKVLTLIVFVAFISGHFWLYPNGKSNGWDVTLKYTSYEKNRVQFWNYLIENNISSQEIESAFPLFCSLKQTNLTLGERLLDINEIPQKDSKYIAYSSVCNDMKSFANIDKNPKYLLIQKFGKGTTSISVYKKLEN